MYSINTTIQITDDFKCEQQPTIPVSFLIVQMSDDYIHNFAKSESNKNKLNEIIVIDNRSNLFFNNLSEAIAQGIAKANNEIIIIVGEDVVLPRGWQVYFERSLERLEKYDPLWGVIGCLCFNAWDWPIKDNTKNKFAKKPHGYEVTRKLEGHILVLHKPAIPEIDLNLPSIHHFGMNLINSCKKEGRASYIIDAPGVHKYANKAGDIIETEYDYEATLDHTGLIYQLDKSCCDEYVKKEYSEIHVAEEEVFDRNIVNKGADKLDQLDSPVLLIGRGGGGTRLLGTLASDAGIFIGNELNCSMDALEMVMPVYQGIFRKYRCKSGWQKKLIVGQLRSVASEMINDLPVDAPWGFKLPESILLLPELAEAFPKARYISFTRDPLAICLRRTHLTARLDNHIGRITLPLAYDYGGIERRHILTDSPALHMAYTTAHQLDLLNKYLPRIEKDRLYHIRFEDVISNPEKEVRGFCDWMNIERRGMTIESLVDKNRAVYTTPIYSVSVVQEVEMVLTDVRKKAGYA